MSSAAYLLRWAILQALATALIALGFAILANLPSGPMPCPFWP